MFSIHQDSSWLLGVGEIIIDIFGGESTKRAVFSRNVSGDYKIKRMWILDIPVLHRISIGQRQSTPICEDQQQRQRK